MEPNIAPGTTPENNINPTPTVANNSPESSPKKSSNLFLIFLTIISLITAVVFAVLFFLNQPKPSSDDQGGSSEQNPPTSGTESETEITDAYILRDLDEKISILLYNSETSASFNSGRNIVEHDLDLFEDGVYDQSVRAGVVAYSIPPETLDYFKLESIISENTYDDVTVTTLRDRGFSGIEGEKVRKKYQDVFGESLSVGAEAKFYCGFNYNTEYDFYYENVLGCGGTTPYIRHYYKSNYTVAGDYAYVYVSTALLNLENDTIYCDITSLSSGGGLSDDAKICETTSDSTSFSLNASNYESYSKYRFVFQKSDTGTYAFKQVERL